MAKQAKYKKSFDSDIKLGNNNFQKILKFYLFECPTPGKAEEVQHSRDLAGKVLSNFLN